MLTKDAIALAVKLVADSDRVAEVRTCDFFDCNSFTALTKRFVSEGWVLVSIDTNDYDSGRGELTFWKYKL